MSGPREGDRVRVTFEADYLVARPGDIAHKVQIGGSVYLVPFGATVELLPPPEPPPGSIVTDRRDRAWQRYASGWLAVGSTASVTWNLLNGENAPLLALREGAGEQ